MRQWALTYATVQDRCAALNAPLAHASSDGCDPAAALTQWQGIPPASLNTYARHMGIPSAGYAQLSRAKGRPISNAGRLMRHCGCRGVVISTLMCSSYMM